MSLLVASMLAGPATSYAAARKPLPVGTDVDYQLGGARRMPPHVGIVVRDRHAQPQPERYNVCYVNGFQTQAEERRFWRSTCGWCSTKDGKPVVDEAWNEWLLDVRTPAKRQRLAQIVGNWTRRCGDDGFDAVEFDNLDSFTRSHGLMRRNQAVAYARLLVRAAHGAGLAAGQKNLAGFDGRTDRLRLRGCGGVRAVAGVRKVRRRLRSPGSGDRVPAPGLPPHLLTLGRPLGDRAA